MPRPYSVTTSDGWKTLPIKCDGGLILNSDILTQSAQFPGSAIVLQNFEPALEGGYKRILGHNKWDAATVTGSGPILGVKVGLSGVFAVRYNGTTDNAVYFSLGSGWTKVNTTARPGLVTKARGVTSYIITPAIIFLDGINYAGKWDGATWTVLNGTDAPLGAKWGAVLANRLILAGYGTSREITISEPNSDIAFTAGGGAISIPIADKIMGIKTFRETLYIYCENSIKILTGSTSADFAIADVTNSIGCIAGDSIQELGGDVIFLAPDGFRSTAATSRIGDVELGLVSKQIQPLVRTELVKNGIDDIYSSCVIRSKSQYRVFFNDADTVESGQTAFLGRLDERTDPLGTLQYSWATMKGIKPYCADSAYTANKEIAVFGHPTDGYVRRMEQATSFDGVSITAIYRSPDLIFDNPELRKVAQRVTTYTQVEGDLTAQFSLILDRGDVSIPQPSPLTIAQTGSLSTYGTAIYGTSTFSSPTYPVFGPPVVGSGKTIAILYTSNDTNPPYRIDDFTITYSLKGLR